MNRAGQTTEAKPPKQVQIWEAFGEAKTFREWAADPRCSHGDADLLNSRYRIGMPAERAITEPRAPWGGAGKQNRRDENPGRPKKHYSRVGLAGVTNRTLTAYGETKTLREWLLDVRCELGTCATLIRRIEFGMTRSRRSRNSHDCPPGKDTRRSANGRASTSGRATRGALLVAAAYTTESPEECRFLKP